MSVGHPIGTRVRVLRAGRHRGRVGTVTGEPRIGVEWIGERRTVWRGQQPVDLDGFGPARKNGAPYGFHPSDLTPIDDDDSRRVVSWDECPWQPGVTRPETCK